MFLKKLLLASVAMAALVPVAWADEELASLTDGNYYIYSTATKTFLSRGNDWGSRAAVDPIGLPLSLTTDGTSVFTYLAGIRTQNGSSYNDVVGTFFNPADSETALYSDGSNNNTMYIYKVDGGYKIKNAARGTYVKFDGTNAVLDSEGEVLQILTGKERQAILKANRLSDINTALEKVNVSPITSEDELSEVLADNGLMEKDLTSLVANSDFSGGTTANWTLATNGSGSGNEGYHKSGGLTAGSDKILELYEGFGSIQHDAITVENSGLYRVSFQGYQRQGVAATCVTRGNEGIADGNAYVLVNGVSVMLPDWYSDRTSDALPQWLNEARTSFDNGKYAGDVYVYVDEDKTINISVEVPGKPCIARWITLDNVKLYYYSTDLTEIKSLYESALTSANGLIDKKMNPDALAELKSAIAAYSSVSSETAKPYITATNALNAAVETAQSSVDAYASAAAELAYINNLLDNTNVYTEETHTALVNEVAEVQTKYDNASLADSEARAVNFTATAAEMVFSTWTRNNTEYEFRVNTWSTEGNTDGSEFKVPFVEYWRWLDTLADATLTSTMTDLPEGKYKLTMDLRLQKANGAAADAALSGVSVSVNGETAVPFSVDAATLYPENSLYIQAIEAYGNVIDGTLRTQINVESTTAGWVSFKNVKYERVGDVDASVAYETALTHAKSLQSKSMQPAVLAKLNSTVDQYGSLDSSSSIDDYRTAVSALNEVSSLAEQSVAVTATGAEEKLNKMRELTESTNVYSDEALATYYTNPWAAFQDGTMTVAEANNLQNPYATMGWHAANTADDLLLSLWGTTDYNGEPHINVWSEEANTDGSGFVTPFLEYWVGDTGKLGARTLTATIPNLDASKEYLVTTWTRVRLTNNASNPQGITLQVGEGTPVNVCTGSQVGTSQLYLDHFTAVGKPDANGNLAVKYIVATDNNISWLSFKDLNYAEVPEAETRTSAENTFGTISLPYAFTAEGATLYTVDGIENNYVNLTEAEGGAAGAAYIYQATASEQSFSYKEGALVSTPSTSILTGVFEATKATADTYVLQTQDGVQAFYKVAEGSEPTIGAFRAYLTVPSTEETTEESAAAIRISLNGEVTGIDAVNALTNGNATIYDLNGRKLNKLQKGINIVNGVKVIVK